MPFELMRFGQKFFERFGIFSKANLKSKKSIAMATKISLDHKLTDDLYYSFLQISRTKDIGGQRYIYFPLNNP